MMQAVLLAKETWPLRHVLLSAPGVMVGIVLAAIVCWLLKAISKSPLYVLIWFLVIGPCLYWSGTTLVGVRQLLRWAGNNYGPGGGPFAGTIAWTWWGVAGFPSLIILTFLLVRNPWSRS